MSLLRVLRSPLPVEEGGVTDDDEFVSISRRELEELRAKVGAVPPGVDELTRTGNPPEVGTEADLNARTLQDERTAGMERAYRSALLDRELATVLAGKPIIAGSVTQLIKLWRDELDVYEDDGAIKVATRDGRTVVQAVNDWLASPDYSHFCRATSRGGTGSQGLGPTSGPSTSPGPRSLGEAILSQWREVKPPPGQTTGLPGWGRSR
jgi:hypothetical protein